MMSLRIPASEKALLLRASVLRRTNLTDFVLRAAVEAARQVIDPAEGVPLTERDSQRVLDLLENPPAPSVKLLAAAKAELSGGFPEVGARHSQGSLGA